MLIRTSLSILAVAALLASTLAVAQEDDAAQPDKRPGRLVYTGEITDLEESSFRIKPWSPRLPRRIQVTATGTTRYLKQVEAGREHLKPGDVVLVVEDPRPVIRLRAKPDETKDEKEAREAREKELRAAADAKPGKARAALRLRAGDEAGVTEQDRTVGNVLLRGARGHFKGQKQGGVNYPGDKGTRFVGVVKAVRPLTLAVGNEEKVFETYGETVWLDHLPIKPEDLKKGKTVVIQSPTPLGADGALQALLIAQVPEPPRSPGTERRLILRERKGSR